MHLGSFKINHFKIQQGIGGIKKTHLEISNFILCYKIDEDISPVKLSLQEYEVPNHLVPVLGVEPSSTRCH